MLSHMRVGVARLLVVLFVVGASTLAPAPSAAQELDMTGGRTAADPAAVRAAQEEGDTNLKKGDYFARKGRQAEAKAAFERALAAYLKAWEAGAAPTLHYQLGLVYDKLGKSLDAAKQYRKFLSDAKDARGDERSNAQERLDVLMGAFGAVTINVDPVGASLELGGNPIGIAPLADPLLLLPGEYTLTISADGFVPQEAKLSVEAGSEAERKFTLDKVTIIVETPKQAPVGRELPDGTIAPPPVSKRWLWVGGGVTIALAGVATTTGILASKRHGVFTAAGSTDEERADARSSGRTLAFITDLTIGATLVAAGVTTYYYLTDYRPRAQGKVTGAERTALAPWLGSDGGGLAVVGGF